MLFAYQRTKFIETCQTDNGFNFVNAYPNIFMFKLNILKLEMSPMYPKGKTNATVSKLEKISSTQRERQMQLAIQVRCLCTKEWTKAMFIENFPWPAFTWLADCNHSLLCYKATPFSSVCEKDKNHSNIGWGWLYHINPFANASTQPIIILIQRKVLNFEATKLILKILEVQAPRHRRERHVRYGGSLCRAPYITYYIFRDQTT